MKDFIESKVDESNKKFLDLAAIHQQMAETCEKAANTTDETELEALAAKYSELLLSMLF